MKRSCGVDSCEPCNLMLGGARDRISSLRAAVDYLIESTVEVVDEVG